MSNEDVDLNEVPKFMLSGSTYDNLKRCVMVLFPAFSAVYLGLDGIWNLPAEDKVVGTVAVITTFLGVILSISSRRYQNSDARFDGIAVPVFDPGGIRQVSLELKNDPETMLATRDELTFKVQATNVE